MNNEELPSELENRYKINKNDFMENLKELNEILKKQNKSDTDKEGKNSVINFIDKNNNKLSTFKKRRE